MFLIVLKKKITKIALYQRYIFLPTFFNKVVLLIFNEYFSLSSSDYPHLILPQGKVFHIHCNTGIKYGCITCVVKYQYMYLLT